MDTGRIGAHRGVRDDSLARVTQGLGRVLVVDDDEVIRQLIAVNLTLEGFEVVTAVDGRDCLEKVGQADPDVITLDVMMPRLDGWVTATQLRKNPKTAGIKVVLITARAQEDDRSRGRPDPAAAHREPTPPRSRSCWPARPARRRRRSRPGWPPGCAGWTGSAPRRSPAAAISP